MERRCANCRYIDLESDALPCADCSHCRDINKFDHWSPQIEDITDSFERLGAILENQAYLLLEMGRLRNELNKLIDIVKTRGEE